MFVTTCAVETRGQACDAPCQNFLCSKHRDELVMWLWDIGGLHLGDSGEYQSSLLDELDVTICGTDKVGGASIGIVSRSSDTPLVFNEKASDLKRDLCNAVQSWARVFAEDNQHLIFDVATIEDAARWMAGFPNLLASHVAAVEMHADFEALIYRARRAIDRPAQRVYLGECGGPTGNGPCGSALYGIEGKSGARCHDCGTDWLVEARRRTMLGSLEDRLAHSGTLAAIVKANGVPLASSTIRNYARAGKVTAVARDLKGRPLYRVGDVLDVLLKRDTAVA